jgi:hypothetical protein
MLQLRTEEEKLLAATAGAELFPRLQGMPKLVTDDEVAVIYLGKLPFVLGKIQRAVPTMNYYEYPTTFEDDVTFSGDATFVNAAIFTDPATFEAGANSPYFLSTTQDSSDVSSTTDAVNYSDVIRDTIVLPTGTWRIWCFGIGLFSHASGGTVRARILINASSGTSVGTGMPAPSQRGAIAVSYNLGSQSGSVDVALQYRSGSGGTTASSGGGMIWMMMHRTS